MVLAADPVQWQQGALQHVSRALGLVVALPFSVCMAYSRVSHPPWKRHQYQEEGRKLTDHVSYQDPLLVHTDCRYYFPRCTQYYTCDRDIEYAYVAFSTLVVAVRMEVLHHLDNHRDIYQVSLCHATVSTWLDL